MTAAAPLLIMTAAAGLVVVAAAAALLRAHPMLLLLPGRDDDKKKTTGTGSRVECTGMENNNRRMFSGHGSEVFKQNLARYAYDSDFAGYSVTQKSEI